MDKKFRDNLLDGLANNEREGKALRDLIVEMISELRDANNYDKKDFEIDGRASLKAAEIIKKKFSFLEPKGSKTKKTTSYK